MQIKGNTNNQIRKKENDLYINTQNKEAKTEISKNSYLLRKTIPGA